MSLLAALVIRPSVVLGAGLLLAVCLKKRSAALRHFVVAASILGAALVVPVSAIVPVWEVALPARPPVPPRTVNPAPAVESPAVSRVLAPAARVETAVNAAPSEPISWLPLVSVVWLTGFIVTAAGLLTGIVRLARIAARARHVDDEGWLRAVRRVAAGYGIEREVVLLQTDAPALLATWGILRPRVLLPVQAQEWPEDRIHVVLCHELAHVRRHDWSVQIAAEGLRTLLWFNPLVWIACRRLRRESEQACDDAVLERGVAARAYAAHLLELARKFRLPESSWSSAMPMAHPSTLERRIAAMLNPRLDRQALSRRAIAAVAVLLVAVTLPIAALRGAQGVPAVLSGSVYDATGAVLPGVELALEDANQFKWSVTTDASGRFEFVPVQAGKYVLAASLPGFKALRHEFELKTSRDWDRAVTLQVGDLKESISVRESRIPTVVRPASSPEGPRPIRVGGNIRVPRKLLDVRPVYPVSMRAAGRDGVVPIEAIIGRDGTVTTVRVLTAQVHPDFAIAAVDAVRQWKFSPTLLNGAPVEVVMNVSVTFNLSD
jgi:TonB family protein